MYTFQDFQKAVTQEGLNAALNEAIVNHTKSDLYKTAKSADAYDHQRNETITNYIQTIFYSYGCAS